MPVAQTGALVLSTRELTENNSVTSIPKQTIVYSCHELRRFRESHCMIHHRRRPRTRGAFPRHTVIARLVELEHVSPWAVSLRSGVREGGGLLEQLQLAPSQEVK